MFQFTKDSYVVQAWVAEIQSERRSREEVPNIFNLREIVFSILDEE